jgi:hypothetical protein
MFCQGGRDFNFSSVSLLLHMDGSGSTFTDSSASPKTVTAQGNATQSTTQSKFGAKAMYCDGNGDGVTVEAATTNGFAANAGDWTIELWAYPTEIKDQHLCIISNSGLSVPGFNAYLAGDGTIVVNNASNSAFEGGSYSIDSWQHFAFVRSGSTITIYRDGVSQGTTSQTPAGDGQQIAFGYSAYNFGNHFFNGYLDEIRYTQGVARYTATFTPPTAAFEDF